MKERRRRESVQIINKSRENSLSSKQPSPGPNRISRFNSFSFPQDCQSALLTLTRPLLSSDPKNLRIGSRQSHKSDSMPIRMNELRSTGSGIFIQETKEKIMKLPLAPETAIKVFSKQLSEHEKGEIVGYREVYYVGKGQKNDIMEFDDLKHNLLLCEGDHVAYRYEVKELLGVGCFSQVYRVFDWKHREETALKVIRSKEKYQKQANLEILLLRFISENANGLNFPHILSSFTFRAHTCIVFRLIGPQLTCTNLSKNIIASHCKTILSCLSFLHANNIIHCDLKPENLLISSKQAIYIIDLGTACINSKSHYKYIQSRRYRAPEVVFRINYNEKIDMWSFGCLLYEMCVGQPLFEALSEKDIVREIVELIGRPQHSLYKTSFKFKEYILDSMKKIDGVFEARLDQLDLEFRPIIKDCLVWEPGKRLSASQGFEILCKISERLGKS